MVSNEKKIMSYVLVVVLVLNLVLFSFTIYSLMVFWIILAVGGVLAYLVKNKMD